MGRELKRVPLDFAWPLEEPWKGFINPHYVATKCLACGGSGSSLEANRLKELWYGYIPFRPEDRESVPFQPTDKPVQDQAAWDIERSPDFYGTGEAAIMRDAIRLCERFNSLWMHHLNEADVAALLEANRLHDFTSTWSKETGWVLKDPPYIPTPAEVNAWSLRGFGHDSINCWVCIEAECKRLGVPYECEVCHGHGALWPSEEARAIYDNWEREEPPTGEGYQIWETVSEGSPISPVFASPEELATHMATTRFGADKGTSYGKWLQFINGPGWAPSMIADEQGLRTGVEAVTE